MSSFARRLQQSVVHQSQGSSTITHGIQLTKAMVGHTAYYDSTLGRNLTDSDLTAGPTSTSSDGQVIYAKKITGGIDINHNNVTLRGCWIVGEIDNNGTSLVLDHCEIGGRGNVDSDGTRGIGVSWSDYSATRCYVHNFIDGFRGNGNVTITECYVDGQEFTDPTGHHDSIQITEGSNITILRCNFQNNMAETSCFGFGSDQGAIDNVLLKDCYGHISWDAGSGYVLYSGDSGCTHMYIEGMIADSSLGDSRAVYPSARPASGHLTGCKYSDGTVITDESWGGL
jgi:hypothetical protein